MTSLELLPKNITKQVESIKIATELIEFSYRLQFLNVGVLQELFVSDFRVKNVIIPSTPRTSEEVQVFLYNHLHSVICSFWISIDEAFDTIFGDKRSENYSFLNNFRVIIYMFRCAFAHEISEPKWVVRDKYRKQYNLEIPMECRQGGIECFKFDFAILNGQNVQNASFGGLAGLKTLSKTAHKLLIEQKQL